MEALLDSLLQTLEHTSGRGIALFMGVVGLIVWWMVSRVRKSVRHITGEDTLIPSESPEPERPRKRLPLRTYHR